MLLWGIKVVILSALVITLGHFLWEHFNEQTNQPKIHQYDKSYKKILNVLEQPQPETETETIPLVQVSPQIVPQGPSAPPLIPMPTQSVQQVSSDTTSIVNLPVYEEQNMEESLKDFMVNNT
jgi:hypothetical protein